MSIDFWLSVIFAIPLAIVANIITPRLQKWWENRSRKYALIRNSRLIEKNKETAKRLREDLDRITLLHTNKNELQLSLTVAILKATLIGALTAMAASLLFAYAFIPRFLGTKLEFITQGATMLGQFMSLLGSLLVYTICNRAFREYTRVKDFSEFKEKTEKELSQIESEITDA